MTHALNRVMSRDFSRGLRTSLALCFALVAGCRGVSSSSSDAGLMKLAVVFDDSMGQASLGMEAKRGAMMAIEEARSSDFRAVYCGDAGAADAARDAVAAIGFTDSDELREVLPAFAAAGTPVMVAGATDPCLAKLAGGELLSFACFSDPMQGAAMAEFAHDRLAARKAVVMFDAKSEFARAVGAAFTTSFRGLAESDATVIAFSGDFAQEVERAVAKSPNVVYVAALPQDASRIIEALRARGFKGAALGPDSFDEPSIFAARNLGAVYYSTHAWLAGRGEPAIEAFVARYRAKFDGMEPTAFAALGYDATRMAIAALERAKTGGTVTRATVARAMHESGSFDGISGAIAAGAAERFPSKAVWIVETGTESARGGRQLASRWEPTHVPDAACGKAH